MNIPTSVEAEQLANYVKDVLQLHQQGGLSGPGDSTAIIKMQSAAIRLHHRKDKSQRDETLVACALNAAATHANGVMTNFEIGALAAALRLWQNYRARQPKSQDPFQYEKPEQHEPVYNNVEGSETTCCQNEQPTAEDVSERHKHINALLDALEGLTASVSNLVDVMERTTVNVPVS